LRRKQLLGLLILLTVVFLVLLVKIGI